VSFDSDADYYEGLNGPADGEANAECHDCGQPWYRSEFDSCVWCGPCAQRRDEWATAMELKRMAKAVLAVDLTKIKGVA